MIKTDRRRREMLQSLGVDLSDIKLDTCFMWAGTDSNDEEKRYFSTTEVIQALIDKMLILEDKVKVLEKS